MGWGTLLPLVQDFWRQVRTKLAPASAPGRLKQWLVWLARNYPEAAELFAALRTENDCDRIDGQMSGAISAGRLRRAA